MRFSRSLAQLGPLIPVNSRRASRISLWHRALKDLVQRGTWVQALRVQQMVVRNAVGSIACAWLVNACYFAGNVFSLKPSRLQSRYELIIANVVWCGVLYAVAIILLTQRFIGHPKQRPSVLICATKLLRGSGPCIILTLLLMFGMGTLVAQLSQREGASRFKAEFYCIVCATRSSTPAS